MPSRSRCFLEPRPRRRVLGRAPRLRGRWRCYGGHDHAMMNGGRRSAVSSADFFLDTMLRSVKEMKPEGVGITYSYDDMRHSSGLEIHGAGTRAATDADRSASRGWRNCSVAPRSGSGALRGRASLPISAAGTLARFSSPIVVSGPCPATTRVPSSSVSSLPRRERRMRSPSPPHRSVRPMPRRKMRVAGEHHAAPWGDCTRNDTLPGVCLGVCSTCAVSSPAAMLVPSCRSPSSSQSPRQASCRAARPARGAARRGSDRPRGCARARRSSAADRPWRPRDRCACACGRSTRSWRRASRGGPG